MPSLYQQSVPMMIRYMKNFGAMLEKGKAFADAKGMTYEEMLSYRLVEDQKP